MTSTSAPDAGLDFRAVRHQLKSARAELDPKTQHDASKKIIGHIQADPKFLSARRIATYWANQGEVNLLPLTTRPNQTQYLPILQEGIFPWAGKGLLFGERYSPLLKNRYGIPEPVNGDFLTASQIDYLLIPLVGFDRKGNRIGMGGGYYDRALAAVSDHAVKLGVGYSFQELSDIQPQAWDVPLDGIVTEEELFFVGDQ